jgi:hypothetical protein
MAYPSNINFYAGYTHRTFAYTHDGTRLGDLVTLK